MPVLDDFGGLAYEWHFIDPDEVINKNPNGVGDLQCVALVKDLLKMPATNTWFEDVTASKVYGNPGLQKGKVIATFVDGVYLSFTHFNHAAIYVEQEAGGIWVVDQWYDRENNRLQPPHLRFISADNSKTRSNNAFAFSVVRTSDVVRRKKRK